MVNVQLPAGSTPAPRFTGGERMIDREKLMTTLQYRINEARNKGSKVTTIFISTLSDCMTLLKEQEAVIHCIDCCYYHKPEYGFTFGDCTRRSAWYQVNEKDYCSLAKRKEGR